MKNNDILKKLRVALKLTDQDILDILKLVDFEIGKGALGDFFRKEDHPKFVEAGDQVVRNFLNGLIIYKRGPMTERKSGGEAKKSFTPRSGSGAKRSFSGSKGGGYDRPRSKSYGKFSDKKKPFQKRNNS